ncbi:MAG: hypothetical protein Q9187_005809 [Circinaria calcarea]
MHYLDLFPPSKEVAQLCAFIDFEHYSTFLRKEATKDEINSFKNAVERVKENHQSGRAETYIIFGEILAKYGFGVLWDPELDTVVKSWMELPNLESGHKVERVFMLAVSDPMIKGIENLHGASAWHKRELLHAWNSFLDRNMPSKRPRFEPWSEFLSLRSPLDDHSGVWKTVEDAGQVVGVTSGSKREVLGGNKLYEGGGFASQTALDVDFTPPST